MTDDSQVAVDYLKTPNGAFWEWRDGGGVVTWVDGTTIAFRPELAELLTHLAPNGLPPFGAILLLLAATRDSWDEPPGKSKVLIDILESSVETWNDWEVLNPVWEGLGKVRQLEPARRATCEARGVLAELVFERAAEKISSNHATAVIDQLYHGLSEDIIEPHDTLFFPSEGTRVLLRDLKCLRAGLARVNPEVLRLRHATGLDQVPQAAELDLPPADRVRALLAVLVKDDELHGLAKLAHHLMAAVTLPRAVADHDELQVGGVSDITNRGPLDRLLLSELAHDDLTLAVRVAENEALYLRRESPPRSPPRQRAVLLEAGIRTWGVPRVFATAVALALAATTDRTTEVLVYRAKGQGIEPVDLTTRAGLVAHLAALEPDLHPGRALEAFQIEMAKADNPALPVLVTTDDVLSDKEFLRALTKHDVSPLHVAAVNRKGRFRLIERSSRGSKLFREATLDLESLFAQSTHVVPTLIDREWARDLPAILSVEPFPLLMSHNIDPKRSWSVRDRGVLTLTKDRRLLFWEKDNQGGRQLADNVPSGEPWWSTHATADGRVRAVVGSIYPHGLRLLDIDLDRYRCVAQRMAIVSRVQNICSHNGVLFALYPRSVHVIGTESGEIVQTLDLPTGMTWIRDRFFRATPGNRWYALSYDGRTAHLEPVLDENSIRCPKLLTLFECDGVEGPIGLTSLGDFYSTSTNNLRKVAHGLSGDLTVRDISRDGRRIALEPQLNPIDSSYRGVVIDAETLRVARYPCLSVAITDPEYRRLVRPVNLRHRFTNICVVNGTMTLTSRKQHQLGIEYDESTDLIVLRGNAETKRTTSRLTFNPVPTPPEIGFRLSRATWNDGSEAFLDSRGLLHLRSSDRSIPEISIVLTDGKLSGWCSDGRLWGARYFIGDGESASQRQVFESVIKAFSERVRR